MNLNTKKSFNSKIIARYSETDSMSYVHHSNYLKYYEIGRLAWFKNIGFSYKKLEDEGIILPVVRTNITFRRPAYFEDELDLQTTLISEPSYSIEFNYKIFKKTELINEGYTRLLFLNKQTSKPIRCPKKISKAIIN